MARPVMWRRVNFLPRVKRFTPAGIPRVNQQEVQLLVEEAEAIRLKDVEELEQAECARKMGVSRTTFYRILDSARKKIGDALLNGKVISIDGGNYEMALRRFRCLNNHEWDVPFEKMVHSPPQFCPQCNTGSIMPFWPPGLGWGGRGRGWAGGSASGKIGGESENR